jgi:hypothetical protein
MAFSRDTDDRVGRKTLEDVVLRDFLAQFRAHVAVTTAGLCHTAVEHQHIGKNGVLCHV